MEKREDNKKVLEQNQQERKRARKEYNVFMIKKFENILFSHITLAGKNEICAIGVVLYVHLFSI